MSKPNEGTSKNTNSTAEEKVGKKREWSFGVYMGWADD